MGGCLVILSLGLIVVGAWWPAALWPVYLLWGYLWVMSLPWDKFQYNPEKPFLEEDEVPVFQKYQAFFKMPYTAAGLSNAGGAFTIVTFVALIVYACLQRWIDAAALGMIWYILGGFRRRMHPTFMLREEKKRHANCGNENRFLEVSGELALVQSVLSKTNPAISNDFFQSGDFGTMDFIHMMKRKRL